VVNYEDINGEGGDALGTWQALSTRGKLQPQDQDFNKFKSIHQLQMAMRKPIYRNEIDRMKKAEEIEKHKRTRKDVVIVDNERYFVIIPMNYGACYTFAHAAGYKPTFCTSSSSGPDWFKRYAPEGMIVSITDKANQDEANGKWQFHAQTHQLVNGDQDRRHDVRWNDDRFSKMFPGLMKQIVAGIEAKAEEINQASQDVTHGGYDVAKEVQDIKTTYPLSYASVEQGAEPAADDQPRGQELY
jgi:hypothetical protein